MKRRLLQVSLLAGFAVFLASCTTPVFHQAAGDCDFDNWEDQSAAVALFPWLANGVTLDGQGPFYGSATIQNLESDEIEVDILVGAGTSSDNWNLAETFSLNPNESISLDASDLGISSDSGASVVALGYLDRGEAGDDDEGCAEDAEYGKIAGLAKSVGPVQGSSPSTTSAHETVDGYSAMRLDQVKTDVDFIEFFGGEGEAQKQFVLPIVQTNSGWDTTIRVSNFNAEGTGLSNVSITLYEAGGQGFGGESQVINRQLRPGGVTSVTLSDYVAEGWVGSAFITSNASIGAVAERHKAENDMLVTNISRPLTQPEVTELYAPLVFKDYNFWNTGISVANTSENQWNQVTIQYYGPTMNVVATDTLNIPPRGMEFIHTPGTQSLGLGSGFVGSAKLTGTQPFHAAVDQVKYFGDDPDVGQAMSYVVEPYAAGEDDLLALPLAQKGNPNTGSGDTSGIQLFNASPSNSVNVDVVFYSAAGVPVAPTVNPAGGEQPIELDLAAHQSYTLYTHNLTEMSAGYQGSVIVTVGDGGGEVVGVSNNVNYDVQGDGSAAFNLVGIPGFGENIPGWLQDILDFLEDLFGGIFGGLSDIEAMFD